MQPIEAEGDGCRIHLHVAPRASKTAVVGVHDGRLKLRVAAPPVDGRANAAIVKWLARALGVPRSLITLASGESGRRKTLKVAGLSADEARERLL